MSATATTEKKYLKWYQKLAYGSGDLASNCSYGLVSSFVLLYLTGTLGLDSAIIGSLMLASKVLDGISDVIFGTLIDRTHSKLGKARPWMLFGQVGVSLCLFLLFAIPAGSTTMQYIYFFIVYTALNAVFYTANGIDIFMGFAVTGMVEKFGSGAAGWRTTALIFAIVGLVVNTISCLAVKELPEEELSGNTSEAAEEGKAVAEEKKHGFAETAKILVHNKYYLMILAIYIVYYIMSNLTTGAGVFCATYYWGDGSLLGQFSMMKMFPVIIALAFAPVLIKKTGSMQKVNFWGYAISSVLGIPMIYFAMQKNLSMFLLFMFIKGVFAGTLSGSLNALIAEASGYTTRTTGVHMDGMMYSCSSLGVKVGGGIGTAAVGWLLKLGGFVGTATVQSESAIQMIFNLYITFPFVIGIIITVLLAFLDVEKANKKWDAEHKKEAQA
ncbi:MAG: MFS transporter [Faecalibacterium prausnitzii]|nr:MFS transporter [Faecalibacterium prausnitzii]